MMLYSVDRHEFRVPYSALSELLACDSAPALPEARKARLATFMLPADDAALIDTVWLALPALAAQGYRVHGILYGALDENDEDELAEYFDRTFGDGAFDARVGLAPAGTKAPERAMVAVRGQFAWSGPAIGKRRAPTAPESHVTEFGPVELALAAFGLYYRG